MFCKMAYARIHFIVVPQQIVDYLFMCGPTVSGLAGFCLPNMHWQQRSCRMPSGGQTIQYQHS